MYTIVVIVVLCCGLISEVKSKYHRKLKVEKHRREICQNVINRKEREQCLQRSSVRRKIPFERPSTSTPSSSISSTSEPHSPTGDCTCTLCHSIRSRLESELKSATQHKNEASINSLYKFFTNKTVIVLGTTFIMNILHDFPELTSDIGMKIYNFYRYFKPEEQNKSLSELLSVISELQSENDSLRSASCSSTSSTSSPEETEEPGKKEDVQVSEGKKEDIPLDIQVSNLQEKKEDEPFNVLVSILQEKKEDVSIPVIPVISTIPFNKFTEQSILHKQEFFQTISEYTWDEFCRNLHKLINITKGRGMEKETRFLEIMKLIISGSIVATEDITNQLFALMVDIKKHNMILSNFIGQFILSVIQKKSNVNLLLSEFAIGVSLIGYMDINKFNDQARQIAPYIANFVDKFDLDKVCVPFTE